MGNKSKTNQLLAQWISQAPDRASEVVKILSDSGLDQQAIEKELSVKLAKPEADVSEVPTFDPEKKRLLSPMLADRMAYAGTISDSTEKWLSVRDIARQISSKKIQKIFYSLKKNWKNSAPEKFREDQISVFGISKDNENDITFIVWDNENGQTEPKIYRYFSQNESVYKNLNEFLKWAVS